MQEDASKLRAKIAALETQLDVVLTERSHLNALLIKCGFLQGIPTLMKTVQDLLESGELDSYGEENPLASSDG